MNLDAILESIRNTVDNYHTLKLSQVSEQSLILRDLSVAYSRLTDYRIEAKLNFDAAYHNSNEKTHAAKERIAEKAVPELYMIRRVMDSTRIVIDAVRSTISAAKHDNA